MSVEQQQAGSEERELTEADVFGNEEDAVLPVQMTADTGLPNGQPSSEEVRVGEPAPAPAAQVDEVEEDEDDEDYEVDEEDEEGEEEHQEMDEDEDESYVPPAERPSSEDVDLEEDQESESDGAEARGALANIAGSRAGLRRRFRARRKRRNQVLEALYSILRNSPGAPSLEGSSERNLPSEMLVLLEKRPKLLLQKDALGRTALHLALLRSRPELVKALLSVEDKELVAKLIVMKFQAAGDQGKDSLPCLHLALSGMPFEQVASASLECLKLLLGQPGLDVQQVDNSGRSALHMACTFGATAAVNLLLEKGAAAGLQDDHGYMPLHYAIDSRNTACVQKMLEASDPSVFSGELHPLYRCIDRQAWEAAVLTHRRGWPLAEADINRLFDFASARGLTSEWNFVCEQGVDSSCTLEDLAWPPEVFPSVSTAVVTHSLCIGHGAIPLDIDDPGLRQKLISRTPENPHRLEVLCGDRGLLRGEAFRDLRWLAEPNPAPLVDLLRVHEFWYIHKLMQRVGEASLGGPLRREPLDRGDTKVTEGSWTAALRACGCVLEAVDQVCNEQVRNAFCAVRPPGHHLGPAGAVDKKDLDDDPEGSQGFCLVNNVAVGAAYARCVYRHVIHRVAIIDFDVHHGNGTEAIVRNMRCREAATKARQVSLDLAGFSTRLSLAPPPTCKPWLDPESDVDNVFFASVHGYGKGFYPGSGATSSEVRPRIINVALPPDSSSADFREGLRTQVLPQLQAFDPDMIFVSAGFDGHEDDLIGNGRNVEEDYAWATQQLLAVANSCCQGRLVSVLEGGYNTRAEVLSPFALSVASHVRTLMHTSQNFSSPEHEAQASASTNPASAGEKAKALLDADRRRVVSREEARRQRRKRPLALVPEEGNAAVQKAPKVTEDVAEPEETVAAAASEGADVEPEPEAAETAEAAEAAQAAETEQAAPAAPAEAAQALEASPEAQASPEAEQAEVQKMGSPEVQLAAAEADGEGNNSLELATDATAVSGHGN
eukprot:gb/GFBE01079905.1/.p1 GENE.gb/GFBE01079905.1/~~gb/GFBE01079905.1/.p1  ORF type:complete len:1002 (+),score=244.01 gb/GFBE01079905.1/:1-3006(+)